jgi:predicted MFS family arabinose efflux permease
MLQKCLQTLAAYTASLMPQPTSCDPTRTEILAAAFAIALGAAVSLGLARFAYALLLPAMRADLGWSYATAGAMNTVNAAGYLIGALSAAALMRRWGARAVLLVGGCSACVLLAGHACVLLAGHAWVRSDAALYALRLALGIASAWMFVSGGLLAARLSALPRLPAGISSAWLLAVFYGGTGLGIVAASALVPPLALSKHGMATTGWATAWLALAAVAAAATALMAWKARVPETQNKPITEAHAAATRGFAWRDFRFGLAAYFCFGLGYIGYMTFIITLLRSQGMNTHLLAAFYALLGAMVAASPWLWAKLLARHANGRPLAQLNTLVGLAALLPVLVAHPLAAFASGALFGACFLSAVASTTALVRHNTDPAAWPQGIAAFTVVFAIGQIIGPILTGALGDAAGGDLRLGLALSAGVLLIGGALATRQKAVRLG